MVEIFAVNDAAAEPAALVAVQATIACAVSGNVSGAVKLTVEPESCAEPEPLTEQATVGAGLPVTARLAFAMPPVGTVTVVGETEICGACGLLVRTSAVREPEVAEPGFGFVTVIVTSPAWEAVAVPVAVSFVAETKLVASGAPPKFTTAPFTNDEPERLIENEPAISCVGETEES